MGKALFKQNRKERREVEALRPFEFHRLAFWWWAEFLSSLPLLLWLRRRFRRNHDRPHRRVAIFTDNLDESNGIAINARLFLAHLRAEGRDIHLVGMASHSRARDSQLDEDGVILLRPRISMAQAGYPDSEVAVPRMRGLIRWLLRSRPDLVEIDTPSSGGMMLLLCARILGIPAISQYRTDMFAYTDSLVADRPALRGFIKAWVRLFSHWSRPVIVPTQYVYEKLQRDVRLAPGDLVILPRGGPLEDFGPPCANGSWPKYFSEPNPAACRFVYVGRISREKGLGFLEEIWPEISRRNPGAELLFIGSGPLLEELRREMSPIKGVAFAGALDRAPLAALLAEAHWFLFPSGTDTFGNAVVEALASGTPALVSDRGGPRDLVEDGRSGRVLPFADREAWIAAVSDAVAIHRDGNLAEWSEAARARAGLFSLHRSAAAFWNFYGRALESYASALPEAAPPRTEVRPQLGTEAL